MEEELRDLARNNGWNRVYMDIKRESASDFATSEASRPQNRHLNRYRDVYPYDHSRVRLDGLDATDYINASLVKAPRANRSYILAQGPLPGTVGHFWLAAWQQGSRAVLMLNRVMEKGQLKCHQYWPQDEGDQMRFQDVGLSLENVGSVPGEHYTVRTLKLSHDESGESREILHFHYTTWPDFGVPQCPDTFLEFLGAVRDSGSLEAGVGMEGDSPGVVGPPVVHCSAGIGRSGTFCLVDTCLVLLAKEGPEKVSVKDVLLELRNYRMGLIQTADQLKFSYLAIAEGAKQEGLVSPDLLADLPSPVLSTDDSDDDGAPPPLPPPRSESLKMQQLLQSILASQEAAAAAAATRGGEGETQTNPGVVDPMAALFPNLLRESGELRLNGNGDHSGGSGSGSDPSPDSDGLWRPPVSGDSAAATKATAATATAAKTDSSPTKCILNNHKMEERKREMELRRRKKEEATAAMSTRVEEMRQKARAAEERQRRRAAWRERAIPVGAALAIMAATAGTYYYLKGGGAAF